MKWIKVSDKLPFEFENLLRKNNRKCTLYVLVYNKKTDSIETDFMIKELYYWNKRELWSWYYNDKNHITHWMPLPKKPVII